MKTVSKTISAKALSILIVVALAFTMCPAAAHAEDTNSTSSGASAAESKDTDAAENKVKVTPIALKMSAKVQGASGWLSSNSGKAAGKTSFTQGITKMKIKRTGAEDVSGDIAYKAYMKGIGWSKAVKNGASVGNGKTANVIQGIRISLKGDLADNYDVYYRTYILGSGWTGWGKNGATVGAPNVSAIRAFQAKLVKKGKRFAGSKKNLVVKNNYENRTKYAMAKMAQNRSSATQWLMMVDTTKNRLTILKGKRGDWKIVKYWLCSPGKKDTPTVTGDYTITGRGLSFGDGFTCWYWTQFYGDYLFHSVTYYEGSMTDIQEGKLGVNISHGCVRLDIKNAKWIYDTIPDGTKVHIWE